MMPLDTKDLAHCVLHVERFGQQIILWNNKQIEETGHLISMVVPPGKVLNMVRRISLKFIPRYLPNVSKHLMMVNV